MIVQPYLFFEGRCEEALGFYQRALGAEIGMLMRNKESPEPAPGQLLRVGTAVRCLARELRASQGENPIALCPGQDKACLGFVGVACIERALELTPQRRAQGIGHLAP